MAKVTKKVEEMVTATTEVQPIIISSSEPPLNCKPSIRIVELQPQVDGSFKDADVAYKTAYSAGVDLCVKEENKIILLPGKVYTIRTGVRLLVKDYRPEPGKVLVGKLYPRSSLRGKGVSFLGTGIIDIDYEGEILIKAILLATGASVRINPGDAIGQLVFEQVLRPAGIKVVEAVRGEAGFGSTGV